MKYISLQTLKILMFFVLSAGYVFAGQNDSAKTEITDDATIGEEASSPSADEVVIDEKDQNSELTFDANTSLPVDVILVLDNSGSMKKNDPQFLVGAAIKGFINQANENTRIGIIIFDAKAELKVPLADASYADRNVVLDSIKGIDYKGQFTDFPAAIERAIYELKENARENAQKSIIFMTDGIVDTGNSGRDIEKSRWMREDLAADAFDNQIKVIGIAFTEAADFQLIQSISQQTSGKYFRVLAAEDLQNVFIEIDEIINQIPNASLTAETDKELITSTAEIDKTQSALNEIDKTVDTMQPRIEAVEKALYEIEEPSLFAFNLFSAIALLLLILTLLFLFLWRKRILKGGDDDFFQEAYINDPKGKTNKQAHILDQRPKMIGRVAGKDIDHMDYIVVNESTISRRHALIEYKDYSFWIIDQGSSNGTFINNERIENEVRLKHGDKIRLHNYEFDFIVPEMDENDETIVYTPGMSVVDDMNSNAGSVPNEITYGLEEIANTPNKEKIAPVSSKSELPDGEEVTVINNTNDDSVDLDSSENITNLTNDDVDGATIDDDDDDDDDDTTVISTINN